MPTLFLSQFWERLRILSADFSLSEGRSTYQTAGGEVLSTAYAERMWRADVRLLAMAQTRAAPILALLSYVTEPNVIVRAYDPAARRAGAPLGGVLNTIDVGGNRIKIGSTGSGSSRYMPEPGDMIGWDYAGRRALHRVVFSEEDGLLPWLTLAPALRSGSSTGAEVDLRDPFGWFRVVPGSVSYGTNSGILTSGIGFSLQQVLRP
jgi:hypothetical protein